MLVTLDNNQIWILSYSIFHRDSKLCFFWGVCLFYLGNLRNNIMKDTLTLNIEKCLLCTVYKIINFLNWE